MARTNLWATVAGAVGGVGLLYSDSGFGTDIRYTRIPVYVISGILLVPEGGIEPPTCGL